MAYVDYYSKIQPVNVFGAMQEAKQARAVAEQNRQTLVENQLGLRQKEYDFEKKKIADTFKALNTFSNEPEESKAAQWPTVRAQIVSLNPTMEQKLPKDWMSDPVGNQSQLKSALKGMSSLITPERITLKTDEVIQERLPGGEFKTIASGPKKPEEFLKMVEIRIGDTTYRIPEGRLPSGSILSGQFVQNRKIPGAPAIPVKEYFAMYPNDWPIDAEVVSGNTPTAAAQPSVNSLSKPPAAPMAVPGQTELPPRQLNVPSPTNRASETNVGYGIDENAMLQQQQIMPTMGNMMLRGAGAVMADEFAPQPRNALVGGMMPQPSQFAELMPAGSAPNRFGSPGVEGIDFAATGGRPKVEIVNGVATYTAAPKPASQSQQRATWTKMTDAQLIADKQDPKRVVGYISSDNEPKYIPIQSAAQWRKEEAEARSAEAGATKAEQEVEKKRADLVNFLIGAKEYRNILSQLQKQPGFDTGPVDTFITSKTPLGQRLISLKKLVGPQLKAAQKVAGDQLTEAEANQQLASLPDTETYMSNNVFQVDTLENYYLRLLGVRAAVSSQSEADALPPNTPFVDLNSVPPKLYITPPKGGYQK
jgi:hypothetical protein